MDQLDQKQIVKICRLLDWHEKTINSPAFLVSQLFGVTVMQVVPLSNQTIPRSSVWRQASAYFNMVSLKR